MKDSQISWIGCIPDNWALMRFKYIFSPKKEIVGDKYDEFERLALTLNGVIKRPKNDTDGLQPKEFSSYQIIYPDDLIFKMIDLKNINTSRVGISAFKGLVSPAYLRFSQSDESNVNKKFFYYYMKSLYYNCVFNNLGDSGVRSSLTSDDIGNFICPVPPKNEQDDIVKFLDASICAIDSLINIENKGICLLKEYEKTLIQKACFQGLNNNNSFKNSGIGYIGRIPSSWQTIKVKSAFSMSKSKAEQINPVVLRLARDGVKIRDISTNEGQLAVSYDDYNPVIPGDLLLNTMDLYSGANCSVSNVLGVISPAYANLRKKVNLNSKYFDYYFKCQYWSMVMFAHGKGVSFDNRWTLNGETLLNLWVPFPSINEQNKIVEYLEKQCSKISKLIESKTKKIDLLNSYKKSLIFEYTTGKEKA